MKLKEILKQLRDECDNGDAPMHSGICEYVEDHDGSIDELTALFKSWDGFSGNASYPIRCPKGLCPKSAFINTHWHLFYDRSHPYGANRMAFLDFAVDDLEY